MGALPYYQSDDYIQAEVRRIIAQSVAPKTVRTADLMTGKSELRPSVGKLLKKLRWPRKKG